MSNNAYKYQCFLMFSLNYKVHVNHNYFQSWYWLQSASPVRPPAAQDSRFLPSAPSSAEKEYWSALWMREWIFFIRIFEMRMEAAGYYICGIRAYPEILRKATQCLIILFFYKDFSLPRTHNQTYYSIPFSPGSGTRMDSSRRADLAVREFRWCHCWEVMQ